MSLTSTPAANRLHIGVFGRRNSGKSSLVNVITGQQVAVVSDVAGTTTDPVCKAMEIAGIGPCLLIDTAGFDDEGELGALRVEKTRLAMKKCDIAILVFTQTDMAEELSWLDQLRASGAKVIAVAGRADEQRDIRALCAAISERTGLAAIPFSARSGEGAAELRTALLRAMPEDFEMRSITGPLAEEGDLVLLVMPQDIQAPRGRLILPQVQTIRDLLDKHCLVMSTTVRTLHQTLAALAFPPKLIITDSQAFAEVYAAKPEQSLLTSFSVLFAAQKGDIETFVRGAQAIDRLGPASHVLIAEACTHAPLAEDIGREKIPRILRAKYGAQMCIDIVSGTDFPEDLSGYDLIVHCGGCMFNRRYVLSRVRAAEEQEVPITNYGILLAKLSGILDKIVY